MATSTPYTSGLKKPLNMLESPVYPDIKKGPPRFVWSRKHWTVDEGATLMSTEPFNQMIEHAVLAQSRDYNKTVYGQSSFRDIVNAEFRPPLISYYEDIGPLTRVPTKIQAIVPRINPGTADNIGTAGYTAKNERLSNIEKSLIDRVKKGDARPTFYAPYEMPLDNSVLPDLEVKLPAISLNAGWTFNYRAGLSEKEIELKEKLSYIPIKPGFEPILKITGKSDLENYQAKQNLPSISAASGMNNPFFINNTEQQYYDFKHTLPQHSTSAGMNTPMQSYNMETNVDYDFKHNLPQYSTSAGMNTPMHSYNMETNVDTLEYNIPQVAASSGMETIYRYTDQTPIVNNLSEKLTSVPIFIANPDLSENYQVDLSSMSDVGEKYMNQKYFNYSVSAGKEDSYKEQNVLTRKDKHREKLQPAKYGNYSQTGSSIPKFGIETPQPIIKERNNKYMINKKKSMYKI